MINENIFHVIKDPVHDTMQFTTTEDNWIKPFIDSLNFQRLRHIKQLGMGDFIFPGAVHTRFNHCLGCCYVASQISRKIGLAEEERQLVITACLLHDIGHGPFSHTFEDLFQGKLIRHEAWTPFFLAEYRTPEFFSYYNRRNPRYHLTEEKFMRIEEMIMHKSPEKRVLGDIVSSQLDADRLDYLLRDSHFCGVTYGKFDFRWMINSMAIVPSAQGERLGITHKGIGVVEQYLMARRLMTGNIYHYQKKLALEFFMIKLLVNLSETIETHQDFAEIKSTRLGKFLIEANRFNQNIPTASALPAYRQNFLQLHFPIYKALCDYDIFSIVKWLAQSDIKLPCALIAKRLHYRQMPKIFRFDPLQLSDIEATLDTFKRSHRQTIDDWQVALIKNPHRSYTMEEDPILVINERGIVKKLDELSLMINAISDKDEQTAFLCIDKAIVDIPPVTQLIEALFYQHGTERAQV